MYIQVDLGAQSLSRYRLCIRLNNVTEAKLTDPVRAAIRVAPNAVFDNNHAPFALHCGALITSWSQAWLSMLFNQRVTEDESHSATVFYELLLPWVCGTPMLQALDNDDPAADWRTPERSDFSAYRGLLESSRYWLRRKGCSEALAKQFCHAIRTSMLGRLTKELTSIVDPNAAAALTTSTFNTKCKPLLGCELLASDGSTMLGKEHLEGKVIGVYFR